MSVNSTTISYSIIIPHYNIPELLMRCLGSIPVREDIQVIVIDDCSPGAAEYKQKYPQLSRPYLEYYSTPKGGSAGRARNIGLDHAKGKWVICMDSDDLFVDNVDEILLDSVNCEEDILYYNYKSVYSNDLSKEANRHQYDQYFEKYRQDSDEYLFRYKFESIWGKIIKRNLIERYHIRCDETRYANDVGFSIKCGHYAKKIKVIDRPFFIVTERPGSLASSQFSNKSSLVELESRLDVALSIRRFLISEGVPTPWNKDYGINFFRYYPFKYYKYLLLKQKKHPMDILRLVYNVSHAMVRKIAGRANK